MRGGSLGGGGEFEPRAVPVQVRVLDHWATGARSRPGTKYTLVFFILVNNPHDLVQGFLLFPIFEQKSENVKKLIFGRPWKHQK